MTFVSPQGVANLALKPRAFNDRVLIEPRIYSSSAQTLARDRRARLAQILELVEAAVLSAGFDNSIGDV